MLGRITGGPRPTVLEFLIRPESPPIRKLLAMSSRRRAQSYLPGTCLRRKGLRSSYRYGQNFLIDLNIHVQLNCQCGGRWGRATAGPSKDWPGGRRPMTASDWPEAGGRPSWLLKIDPADGSDSATAGEDRGAAQRAGP